MCQVYTGAYVSLFAPGKTDYIYRLPAEKDYHVCIARSTYHHAYIRMTDASQLKKETKKKKHDKEKERK